jgi:hypothetical protein
MFYNDNLAGSRTGTRSCVAIGTLLARSGIARPGRGRSLWENATGWTRLSSPKCKRRFQLCCVARRHRAKAGAFAYACGRRSGSLAFARSLDMPRPGQNLACASRFLIALAVVLASPQSPAAAMSRRIAQESRPYRIQCRIARCDLVAARAPSGTTGGTPLTFHFSPLTPLLSGGGSGLFLDQRDQVVGGILDGGNVCLGERLIRGEFLAHVV